MRSISAMEKRGIRVSRRVTSRCESSTAATDRIFRLYDVSINPDLNRLFGVIGAHDEREIFDQRCRAAARADGGSTRSRLLVRSFAENMCDTQTRDSRQLGDRLCEPTLDFCALVTQQETSRYVTSDA